MVVHFVLLVAGWGLFNVAEGLLDHQLLGVHHVRDDLGAPLSWAFSGSAYYEMGHHRRSLAAVFWITAVPTLAVPRLQARRRLLRR
jgi:hypothetical protein